MVIRVVFVLAAAAIAVPALAADRLPYDMTSLVHPPGHTPQIGYDVSGLLYERTPDHVALGYRLEGLTGSVAAYRVVRDVGPLEYELMGLVYAGSGARGISMGM